MYKSIMHLGFYCKNFDAMVDFYTNKLGGKIKSVVRYGEYIGVKNRPVESAIGQSNPDKMYYIYIELADGQFVELYPAKPDQLEHIKFNEHIGYSHFALLVDDINKEKERLIANGVNPDTQISIGPSGTYQMWIHDPDDNRIEVMQFTDHSYQVVGHNI